MNPVQIPARHLSRISGETHIKTQQTFWKQEPSHKHTNYVKPACISIWSTTEVSPALQVKLLYNTVILVHKRLSGERAVCWLIYMTDCCFRFTGHCTQGWGWHVWGKGWWHEWGVWCFLWNHLGTNSFLLTTTLCSHLHPFLWNFAICTQRTTVLPLLFDHYHYVLFFQCLANK